MSTDATAIGWSRPNSAYLADWIRSNHAKRITKAHLHWRKSAGNAQGNYQEESSISSLARSGGDDYKFINSPITSRKTEHNGEQSRHTAGTETTVDRCGALAEPLTDGWLPYSCPMGCKHSGGVGITVVGPSGHRMGGQPDDSAGCSHVCATSVCGDGVLKEQ